LDDREAIAPHARIQAMFTEPRRSANRAIQFWEPKTSNDEVERRALRENEDDLSRSFDCLLPSPKLRGRSNRLLDIA